MIEDERIREWQGQILEMTTELLDSGWSRVTIAEEVSRLRIGESGPRKEILKSYLDGCLDMMEHLK